MAGARNVGFVQLQRIVAFGQVILFACAAGGVERHLDRRRDPHRSVAGRGSRICIDFEIIDRACGQRHFVIDLIAQTEQLSGVIIAVILIAGSRSGSILIQLILRIIVGMGEEDVAFGRGRRKGEPDLAAGRKRADGILIQRQGDRKLQIVCGRLQVVLCRVNLRLRGSRITENGASVLQRGAVSVPAGTSIIRIDVGTDAVVDQRAEVGLGDGGDLQKNHCAGDRIGRLVETRSTAAEIMNRGGAGTGNCNADRFQILFADVVSAAVNVAARCVAAKLRYRIAAAFPQHGAVGVLIGTIYFFHFAVASPIGVLQNIS